MNYLPPVDDFSSIVSLLNDGTDVNKTWGGDRTAILHATASPSVAALLVERRANVDIRDAVGRTPLHHHAATSGHLAIIELLLQHGADVNARDISGNTPLHKAIDVDVVALLISRGADVNAINKYGTSPLVHAARRDVRIAMLLVDAGAKWCSTPPAVMFHDAPPTPALLHPLKRKHEIDLINALCTEIAALKERVGVLNDTIHKHEQVPIDVREVIVQLGMEITEWHAAKKSRVRA